MKLLLLLLLLPVVSLAQTPFPTNEWSSVEALRPGRTVQVETSAGREDCKFTAADDQSLDCTGTIVPSGLFSGPVRTPRHFLRAEVVEVRLRPRKVTRTLVLTALVVGGVAGLVTGNLILGFSVDGVGALLGFVVGEIIDTAHNHLSPSLVYHQP